MYSSLSITGDSDSYASTRSFSVYRPGLFDFRSGSGKTVGEEESRSMVLQRAWGTQQRMRQWSEGGAA